MTRYNALALLLFLSLAQTAAAQVSTRQRRPWHGAERIGPQHLNRADTNRDAQ